MHRDSLYAPAQHDALGRAFSEVTGYTPRPAIPVGSRVRILHDPYDSRALSDAYAGDEAVVLAFVQDGSSAHWTEPQVKLRCVRPRSQMDNFCNYFAARARWVEVLAVGSGSVTPGRDYELARIEILDARYAAMDHRYEGWSNPATYLAHLYLRADRRHYDAVRAMVRKDGSINPVRLGSYFQQHGPRLDRWACFPEGYPEWDRFRYRVNWVEIARDFAEHFRELAVVA